MGRNQVIGPVPWTKFDFSFFFLLSSILLYRGSSLFYVLLLKTGGCFESELRVRAKRMRKWNLLWPFWAIMAVHAVAILIFVKGFLLTRTELPHYSHCSDVSQSPCFTPDSLSDSNPSAPPPSDAANFSRCWTKPAVNRILIIVFDALRFASFPRYFTTFIMRWLWSDSLILICFLSYQF